MSKVAAEKFMQSLEAYIELKIDVATLPHQRMREVERVAQEALHQEQSAVAHTALSASIEELFNNARRKFI